MVFKISGCRFSLPNANTIVSTVKRRVLVFILLGIILFFPLSRLASVWIDVKIKNSLANSIYLQKPSLSENLNVSFEEWTPFINPVQDEETLVTFDEQLMKITHCYDQLLEPTMDQHGNFWVLSNYIRAEKQHRCFESVTYTTQGDYTFLDNLIHIVERWRGPISVALHAPGTDFQPTLNSIAYLRNCQSTLFKEYVTFHLIFDMEHMPTKPSKKLFDAPLWQLYKDVYNCTLGAPYENVNYTSLYKIKANISYPINVLRNIAREKAQTHFVLASDIELYPSRNLINQFLHMVVEKPNLFEQENPVIFVLPVFEVLGNESAPEDKKTLQEMIASNRAFSFHKHICNRCHAIPNLQEWLELDLDDELDIFITAKRQGHQVRWEAVYIGTNEDPIFDERLDWERHGNKMTQAYILCLLDYDYMVLNNAFLVHRPGIKQKMVHAEVIPQTAKYISDYLGVQIDTIYGKRKGCKA